MQLEIKCYNALNVLYKGNYDRLKKVWEISQSWEKAWQKEKNAALDIEAEWDKLEKLKIQLILRGQSEFPPLLREIPFAPFGIYVLGKIDYSLPMIAVVGTRSASVIGREMAEKFSKNLAAAGITVVSGLALGIDAAAHQGALASAGKTIAVLGTALNYFYPKQNAQLAEKILETGGALISEYPLNQEYYPQNFLIRNRLISGLSLGALIIEAPEKSGALATARFALEQNRDIFVIPGNIYSQNYRGSNELIKSGAMPVTAPEDILNYLGIQKTEIIEKGLKTPVGSEEVLKAIKKESLTAEELLRATNLNLSELNKDLAVLVVKGIIKESNGKYYLS